MRRHYINWDRKLQRVVRGYTLVDGKRIKPPNLNERHIRPTEKGLDRLGDVVTFGVKGSQR